MFRELDSRPARTGGETGILVSASRPREGAAITVENAGAEAWPVRILDQVPDRQQDDLEIALATSPKPSQADAEGQRRILARGLDLPAGGWRTVTPEQSLTWPEGMVPRRPRRMNTGSGPGPDLRPLPRRCPQELSAGI